ncbi:MAG: hypothetical protein IKL55_04915 [Clostridia bacterium]|nr:hypothetical protein [Clostridia bacterium]
MESMMVMLQFSIWIIVFILIAMIMLYISVMSKRNNTTNYSVNDGMEKNENMYNQNEEESALNSNDDDDGPIKHL